MPEAMPAPRPVRVRPKFNRNRLQVLVPHGTDTGLSEAEVLAILQRTPGCARVEHTGSQSFWVTLQNPGSDADQVAAQRFIEQALGVPHMYVCQWATARERQDEQGTAHTVFLLFLEPVADHLARAIKLGHNHFGVTADTLYIDDYRLVLRTVTPHGVNAPPLDIGARAGVLPYGVRQLTPEDWNPATDGIPKLMAVVTWPEG